MPLYEYHCQKCGQTLELLVRPGAADPALCGEDCALDVGVTGDGQLAKILSVPGGYLMSGGGGGAPSPEASCGSCGGVPGSCAFDN